MATKNSLQQANISDDSVTGIHIICIGNPLHGNDGFGTEIFNSLNKVKFPPGVRLIDGGTGGLLLLPFFKGCERVLLVDLILDDRRGSEVLVCRDLANDYEVLRAPSIETAGHGGDLLSLLQYLPVLLPETPQIDLVAVFASHTTHFSGKINVEIKARIDEVCNEVTKLISA